MDDPVPDDLAILFDQQRDALRRAVRLRLDRRLLARLDVSDVIQETFLEALRRWSGYRDQADPLPPTLWLHWLAREQVLQLHRKHLMAEQRAVGREVPPLPEESSMILARGLAGTGPSPSTQAVAAELLEKLRVALGQLDDDERDLILWRHFEQLTSRDTAALLGITEAAAGKRYVRALERLRGLMV
jgi:RNA polymerase sigma-70 factor (ECF subfamily)